MSDTSAINRKCDVCHKADGTHLLLASASRPETLFCKECYVADFESRIALTHSPDCWRHHPGCAVKRIEGVLKWLEELDAIEDARRWKAHIAPVDTDRFRAIIAGEE